MLFFLDWSPRLNKMGFSIIYTPQVSLGGNWDDFHSLCKFMDVGRAKRFGGICTFPSGGIVCVLLQIFIIFSLFFWTVFCLERWLVVELVPDFQEAVPRASAHCHAVLGDTKAADTVVVTCQDACSLRSYAVPYVAVEIVVAGEE